MSERPNGTWDQPLDDQWPKTEGSYVGRHWNGDLSLGVSFWFNGFLLNIAFGILVYGVVYAVARGGNKDAVIGVLVAILAFSVVLSVWQLVGIWRSAEKHKLHTGRKGWAVVAQVLVALGWFGLVYNVFKSIGEIDQISRLF
jgi:hypothetical protein